MLSAAVGISIAPPAAKKKVCDSVDVFDDAHVVWAIGDEETNAEMSRKEP
jgi:hypothetical protein